MHRREYLLSATGILGATTVGSIAYTSASVSRSVTSNVAADATAVIGLTSGNIGAVTKTNGKLNVDTSGTADGLNSDGTFTYGDSADPTATYAFAITNNDGNTHDLTLALDSMTLPGSSSFSLTLYDSSGTELGTVTPSGSFVVTDWASTDTVYAHVSIDTSGTTDADSISGTMQFSV